MLVLFIIGLCICLYYIYCVIYCYFLGLIQFNLRCNLSTLIQFIKLSYFNKSLYKH